MTTGFIICSTPEVDTAYCNNDYGKGSGVAGDGTAGKSAFRRAMPRKNDVGSFLMPGGGGYGVFANS